MSRAWMPLYWGDYHRDTAHLTTLQHGAYLLLIGHCWQHGAIPSADEACAAVTKLPLKQWRDMKPTLLAFFRDDGSHKRVELEIERTERKIMQRRLAGEKGGHRSGISRAAQSATKQRSKIEANGKQNGSKIEANGQAKTKQPPTIHNHKDSSSFLLRVKEGGIQNEPAGSLATALGGALARQPTTEQAATAKPPSSMSRAELAALYAGRRANGGGHQ